jgi:hypothetical protein
MFFSGDLNLLIPHLQLFLGICEITSKKKLFAFGGIEAEGHMRV